MKCFVPRWPLVPWVGAQRERSACNRSKSGLASVFEEELTAYLYGHRQMPFRCLDPQGNSIQSVDLSTDAWLELSEENKRRSHLRMPCCGVSVILRTSTRGIRHFVHKIVDRNCVYAAEGEEHLSLKSLVLSIAHSHGWEAATEVMSPNGDWKADVLAIKGKVRVAIEVQWSGQAKLETIMRQDRYRDAGIRGLWLLRQPGFSVTEDLPAVCIGGGISEGFLALLPDREGMSSRDRGDLSRWHQVLPMQEFLEAAFGGRFKFGVQVGMAADVAVYQRHLSCWKCEKPTTAVTGIAVRFGPNEKYFQVEDLEAAKHFRAMVLSRLPLDSQRGEIRYRDSRTAGRRAFSNGCAHCDALLGQHYLIYDYADEATLLFQVPIDAELKGALDRDRQGECWSVYR